jgi:hypothetical protein
MCLGQTSPVETPQPAQINPRQAELSKLALRAVREQTFSSGADGAAFVPHSSPVLRWTNPTVGEIYGEVFVWTHRGRPVLAASIFRAIQPDWGANLELCSLAPGPVAGRLGEHEFWRPTSSAVSWQPLPDAPLPASGSAGRLAQMKRLAGDVTVTLADARNAADPVPRMLRQMPQPVFRYPAAEGESDYLDGALFAFVEGTDPEVLLLIEAQRGEATAAWRFGLARMNRDELRASLRGRSVWHAPALSHNDSIQNPRQPYGLFVIDAETGRVKP